MAGSFVKTDETSRDRSRWVRVDQGSLTAAILNLPIVGRNAMPNGGRRLCSTSCAGRVLRHPPPFKSPGQLPTMSAAACRSRLRPSRMRLLAFIVAMMAATSQADAQGWREYEYPNEGFTVAF